MNDEDIDSINLCKLCNTMKYIQEGKEVCKRCEEREKLKSLFERIEKEFKMEHACDCNDWCNCWEIFKSKELEKIGR